MPSIYSQRARCLNRGVRDEIRGGRAPGPQPGGRQATPRTASMRAAADKRTLPNRSRQYRPLDRRATLPSSDGGGRVLACSASLRRRIGPRHGMLELGGAQQPADRARARHPRWWCDAPPRWLAAERPEQCARKRRGAAPRVTRLCNPWAVCLDDHCLPAQRSRRRVTIQGLVAPNCPAIAPAIPQRTGLRRAVGLQVACSCARIFGPSRFGRIAQVLLRESFWTR